MSGVTATLAGARSLELSGGTLSFTARTGAPVTVSVSAESLLVGRSPSCGLVVGDPRVSAVHAELIATPQGVLLRDLGSRNGTWLGETRIREAFLTGPATIGLGSVAVEFVPTGRRKIALPASDRFGRLYGSGPTMRRLFSVLSTVSPTDLSVLILGETGTGKELVAQAIHAASARRRRPLVVIDCGAIAASLADSIFFGHLRGAFTGAIADRRSPFVEADGGTVFLDELGELPLEVQPRLLRALAEQRVKAVGSNTYESFDVRVVAATRRDLAGAINAGAFRSDLYFRIAQVRVDLPPLRERKEDLAGLVKACLADLKADAAFRRMTRDQFERLLRHDWPGNVRELRNAVSVAVALAGTDGSVDVAAHLGGHDANAGGEVDLSSMEWHEAKRSVLDRFEKAYFSTLLASCEGNVAEVARRTGLQRKHVRAYVKRHDLPARRRKSSGS